MSPTSLFTVDINKCIIDLIVNFVINVVKFAVGEFEPFCYLENVGVHWYAVWLVKTEQSNTVRNFVSDTH